MIGIEIELIIFVTYALLALTHFMAFISYQK